MALSLREILALEGQTKVDGLKDALVLLEGHPYSSGFSGVVVIYKGAAGQRRFEDGHNVSEESIRLFDAFVVMMEQNIIDLGYSVSEEDGGDDESDLVTLIPPDDNRIRVVAALIAHNCASASSVVNGDDVEYQKESNLWALEELDEIPKEDRDDDWHVVHEKVLAGLYEAKHIEWNEEGYNDLLRSMREHHSKDAAGRATYLARKYVDGGRVEEAIEVLELVEEDAWSAPNQKDAAINLLTHLRKIIKAAEDAV